jgi:hypothetical protein
MYYWNEMIDTYAQLQHRSKEIIMEWGLRCVEHAFAKMEKSLGQRIDSAKIEVVRNALRFASARNKGSNEYPLETILQSLIGIRPEPDSKEERTPGWSSLIDAAYELCKGCNKDMPYQSIQLAASSGYYSIAQWERDAYMRKNKRGLVGDELDLVERAIPDCIDEIAYQKRLLQEL